MDVWSLLGSSLMRGLSLFGCGHANDGGKPFCSLSVSSRTRGV